MTTLRRLHHHLADVANLEPIALLVFVPLVRKRARTPAIRAALLVILFHVLAYAPFYFDGDYPGGGARFFADLLPLEHVLVAIGLAWLTPTVTALEYQQRGAALLAASLLGFGVHTVHSHLQLAARDGGRPMFEPDQLSKLPSDHGLVYMTTDHGFDLAYDPLPLPPMPDERSFHALRYRGDDNDRIAYEKAGKPPSYRYVFDPLGAPAEPHVEQWTPPRPTGRDAAWRFEGESSWPPLAQDNAWAEPVWMDGASEGRALVITSGAAPTGDMNVTGSIVVTLPVAVPEDPMWTVIPRVIFRGIPGHGELTIDTGDPKLKPAHWTWDDGPDAVIGPRDLATFSIAAKGRTSFEVQVLARGQVTWDRTLMRSR